MQKYVIKCSKINYGLNYIQIKKLAFGYAKKLGCCPEIWDDKGIAGLEWIKCFMKQHPNLSLKKPENTSMARATGFTKYVEEFQSNYSEILKKFKVTGNRIVNLDETGVSNVIQAPTCCCWDRGEAGWSNSGCGEGAAINIMCYY